MSLNKIDVNMVEGLEEKLEVLEEGKVSVDSLNEHTNDTNNPHGVTKQQVGLSNVDNTSDLNKPVSTAVQSALNSKADNTIATPSVNGIMSSTDKAKLNSIANGAQVNTVDSVAGKVGVVTLSKADVGLASVDNVQQASKADFDTHTTRIATTSTLGHVMADGNTIAVGSNGAMSVYKVNASMIEGLEDVLGDLDGISDHINNSGNPHNVTKDQIGLGNVNNTSDLNKPISTATQTALNSKAGTTVASTSANGLMSSADKIKLNGIESGAQVNTITSVSGKTGAVTLSKGDVGLSNVDNVKQASKSEFDSHNTKIASTTSLGHVKVDGTTIVIDSNGVISSVGGGQTNPNPPTEPTNPTDPINSAIYGVRIDKNNSNPDTRVTYIKDAVGFNPMRGNNGNFDWGSWKTVFDGMGIKPVVLQNKQVKYYLNPNDFTKKADASSAVITGADGDVMIEFGKVIWYKWTDEGGTYTIEISETQFNGAVKHAFEIEDGYNLTPYYPLLLMQILFVIFFKSTNSQTALGRGRVDNAIGYASTGGTNKKGMIYGSTADEQMKFLGIEDFWGNKFWWIDGIVTDVSFNLLLGEGGFNDVGVGYTPHSSGVIEVSYGDIDSVQGGNDKGFIVKGTVGSESTYYSDFGMLDRSRVACFGGVRSSGSVAGAFTLHLAYPASDSDAWVSSRLFCVANGKPYIGVYLGTSVSGKLRSISGTTEPTGKKSIGSFRTEARANN